MVYLQQPEQCNHATCPGHIPVPKGTFGGMMCLCQCHNKCSCSEYQQGIPSEEVTCTDDNLKRLEEELAHNVAGEVWYSDFQALLARLRAAEDILKLAGKYGPEWDAAWANWRRIAGK